MLAERGAEATRFADVSAASGVPISTLQYYFGNREDLLVATFRHEVLAEQAALRELVQDGDGDPWQQLRSMIRVGVVDSERSGETWRIWVEFWRAALRDEELRAEAHAVYDGWRSLVARVVRTGLDSGRFHTDLDPDRVANLVVALIDGIGVPVALDDPALARAQGTATELVEDAVARLLVVAPPIDA